MVKLALCDFHIGVSESDVGGFRRASGVMPAIAKALKGTKWKSKAQDYGGYLMVESKSPSQKYVLNFKKDEKGMWSWLGLNGVTSEDVEPFLKNSYQLYGGAEED